MAEHLSRARDTLRRFWPEGWAAPFLALIVALGPIIGNSVIGLSLIGVALSFVALSSGRSRVAATPSLISRYSRWFCLALLVYAIYFILRGPFDFSDPRFWKFHFEHYPNYFMVPLLLIAARNWGNRDEYLLLAVLPLTLILAFVAATIEASFFGVARPEIGFDNPLPFSLIVVQFSMLLVLGAIDATWVNLVYRALGMLAALMTVLVVTDSRAAVLILLVFIGFAFPLVLWARAVRMSRIVIGALLLVALICLFVHFGDGRNAFTRMEYLIGFITDGAVDHSAGIRVVMMRAGIDAIGVSPGFGFGVIDYYRGPVAPFFDGEVQQAHAHNAFINVLLAGGIAGFCAFSVILLMPMLVLVKSQCRDLDLWIVVPGTLIGLVLTGLTNQIWIDDTRASLLILELAVLVMIIGNRATRP